MGERAVIHEELAGWVDLLAAPEELQAGAELHARLLSEEARRGVKAVLELGAGAGDGAYHLKRSFDLTLADPSPHLLERSRRLNPECRHVEGDMRTLRLGERFDAVLVHHAVTAMTSEADLAEVVATAHAHLDPGGVALFVPEFVTETFRSRTHHGGHDGDGRSLRTLEWLVDPDPEDGRVTRTTVYVLREGTAPARVISEDHDLGLFSRATWLGLLRDAGFAAHRLVRPEPEGASPATDLFLGVRGQAPVHNELK